MTALCLGKNATLLCRGPEINSIVNLYLSDYYRNQLKNICYLCYV